MCPPSTAAFWMFADDWGESPHDSVKNDTGILKASPFVGKGIEVLGYVYDITKGTVEEVR